ncbi:MAG: S53 family peptidase, partial [Thermoplasmata archaeon]
PGAAPPRAPPTRRWGIAPILAVLLVTFLVVVSPALASAGPRLGGGALAASLPPSGRVAVAVANPGPASDPVLGPYRGTVTAMVQLRFAHAAGLSALLTQLQNPSSSQYHRYLTSVQFDALYSPSAATYRAATDYFQSFGIHVTTFSGRTALALSGTPAQVGAAFATTFEQRSDPLRGTYYSASGTPTLPRFLADAITGVVGLNDYAVGHLLGGTRARSASPGAAVTAGPAPGGILPPVQFGQTQLLYAPEFQVAYDELPLLDQVLPVHAVIATILWSGSNETGTPVGPFVPSDITSYFNETLPSGEPAAQVFGIPIAGAPPPGGSASYDVTGASIENTIDLEMIGSTAPGASIYNVYGPSSAVTYLDQAFTTILNDPGLANVSVISNSWGSTDGNNSIWYADLMEAQARGITVLASSGDSGNNPASGKWVVSGVEFPSTMAYNAFGDTGVGGTTLTVNANSASPTYLERTSEIVWNISTGTGNGGPAGTTGGISTAFPTPLWQRTTEANAVIQGKGRGVPDLALVANNTLITITVDGRLYLATNASVAGAPFYEVWGTSIAAPVLGGFVAEMDAYNSARGQPWEGFLNPLLYQRGNSQFHGLSPTPSFYDITSGRNLVYSALKGYDLVTGWGAPIIYALTVTGPVYAVTFVSHGLPGGSSWGVVITDQSFTTTNATLTVNLTSGIYEYVALAPSGYVGSPGNGNFTVPSASPPPIPVNFTAAPSKGFVQQVIDLLHGGYNFLNRYLAPYTPYVLLLIAGILVASIVSSLVDRSRARRARAEAERAQRTAAEAAAASAAAPTTEGGPTGPEPSGSAPGAAADGTEPGSPPTPPSS